MRERRVRGPIYLSRGGGVVRGSPEMELAGVLSPYVSFVTGSSGAPLTPASLSPKKTLEDSAPLVSGANDALLSVSLDTHPPPLHENGHHSGFHAHPSILLKSRRGVGGGGQLPHEHSRRQLA